MLASIVTPMAYAPVAPVAAPTTRAAASPQMFGKSDLEGASLSGTPPISSSFSCGFHFFDHF